MPAPPQKADRWGTVWLCRPGLRNDPCTASLTATVIGASGKRKVVKTGLARKPSIDCFYLYPTVSTQPTPNADLTVAPEEVTVAHAQASRFSSQCRVYAPMYEQLTLAAIGGTGMSNEAVVKAYTSALRGWKTYLAHYNKGRPFVLIGHSQGASLLTRLIAAEIDGKPRLRKQLVSALLLGGNVTVPEGKDVGGDFRHIPACRRTKQQGCVLAYSAFSETPPATTFFGKVGSGVSRIRRATPSAPEPLQVLCVNPANLRGGRGTLVPYFPTARLSGPLGLASDPPPVARTPWVAVPDRYTAECRSESGATWLQVNAKRSSTDERPAVTQTLGPNWGLHLYDVNLALGNLVELVHTQVRARRH
jgi:pimeloyl-ACP methyl ester carboxylesterase